MYILAIPAPGHPLGLKLFGGFTKDREPCIHEVAVRSFKDLQLSFTGMLFMSREFAYKEAERFNKLIVELDAKAVDPDIFVLPLSVLKTQIETWTSH